MNRSDVRRAEMPDDAVYSLPVWSTLPDNIPCPRCGYNLRMLTHPRCPECGLDFEWDTVIAGITEQHRSPLFEHCWRTRPIRSFLRTTLHLYRPVGFWSSVSLECPARPAALMVQAALTALIVALFVYAFAFLNHFAASSWFKPTLYSAAMGAIGPTLPFVVRLFLRSALIWVLTLLTFFLFWQTRRRMRIRLDVLVRLLTYSTMVAWLWTVPLVLLVPQVTFKGVFYWSVYEGYYSAGRFAWPFIAFFVAFAIGMKRHVRVKRAVSMVIMIVVLEVVLYSCIWVTAIAAYDSTTNPVTMFINNWLGINQPGMNTIPRSGWW